MRAPWLLHSCLVLGLIVPTFGYSWGVEGHRAVAELAARYLNPKTLQKINELLAVNGARDLPSIATWADELRLVDREEGPLKRNTEAIAFNHDFPSNGSWHYVDLPLGSESYESVQKFGSHDDVIHAISRCISVLESREPLPNEMTRIQALRLLIHFVGDIHQPLHCGCGFYDLTDSQAPRLISDPVAAYGKPDDRGGNDLYYDSENNQELHAFWDVVVVTAIADSSDYRMLTKYLENHHKASEVPGTDGPYKNWAEKWAIDSVKCAVEAYAGIKFAHLESAPDQRPMRIAISLPAGYAETSKRIAAHQLFAASVHLAQLLDSLQWP